jgi:hypothetical protein
VTIAVKVCVPVKVTEAGDTLHVPAAGAPEQLSATVPVKPLMGATLSVYTTDLPAFTVCELGEAEAKKSVPVPERDTAWGLLAALSAIVIAPALAPVAVGVKLMLMVQLVPAARVPGESGQVLV